MPKKRGNGEGSITRRGDGLYMGRYTAHTSTGPKRKAVYGKTRAEVSEKLTKAMADRDGGMVFEAGPTTAGEYLRRWLTDCVAGTVRQSTYDSYTRIVNTHLIPGLGGYKLATLTPPAIRSFYRDMGERGLSSRTIGYAHSLLKKALKQAVMDSLIGRNPAEAVAPPKLQREEIYPMTAEQVNRLLGAAEGDRWEALYVLAVRTGMRPGEMLALKWEDVDLDGRELRVNRALADNGEMNAPKTAGSRRRIDLSPPSVKALKTHRAHQNEERMAKAGLWEDHGLVFPNEIGSPADRRNITQRSFKPLLKAAGLPDFRLYDLRHTCATLLLSKNVHPKYVAELLGHASISLTLDTYSHVIPGMDGGTASAMEEALS